MILYSIYAQKNVAMNETVFESDEVGYLSDWKALYGLNLA